LRQGHGDQGRRVRARRRGDTRGIPPPGILSLDLDLIRFFETA
jgi:hypothetical protein